MIREIKPPKFYLVFIVLGSLLVLGGAYFIFFSQGRQRLIGESGPWPRWGQRPGGPGDGGGPPQRYSAFTGQIPAAPAEKVTFYKGLSQGTSFYNSYEECEFLQAPTKLKALGVNTFSFAVEFEVNSKGEIRYPLDFPTIEAIDGRIGEIIQKLYGENIRVWLLVQPSYKEQFTREWAGEPKPPPRTVYTQPGFYDRYTKAVVAVAKLAQKYKVELLSPINEPDGVLSSIGGDEEMVAITQKLTEELVRQVKEVYQGKVVYKGDLHEGQGEKLRFQGYDVLGIMPAPMQPGYSASQFRSSVQTNIENALGWARRDGVAEVIVAEFGSWGEGLPITQAQEKHQILFEEAKGLTGVFVNDPPPQYGADYQDLIRGEIRDWYTSN